MSKIAELESQLAQLQDDLKKAKEQLSASESQKKRAQQEAEEAKKQLLAMSSKLEESQQQLLELSSSEDARVQELHKISKDRDRAWQSELEAVQKQHSMDSAALPSAINEIQKLKIQLEMVSKSEAAKTKHAESAHAEIQSLRVELEETLALVEKMKSQLNDSKESEAQALEVVTQTQEQLETAKKTMETLRSECLKAMEAHKSLALELEQSKARVSLLEGHVSNLQAEIVNGSRCSVDSSAEIMHTSENGETEQTNQLIAELNFLKYEVGQLRSALEASEIRYQEEYIQSTLQIRSAYEQLEHTKSESHHREAELEAELKRAKVSIEELQANLFHKESELMSRKEENVGLNSKIDSSSLPGRESELVLELKKSAADLVDLQSHMLDKERELRSVNEENEMLKIEIKKKEIEKNKVNAEVIASAEAARAAEREALMKLGSLTEEADKNSRKAVRVTEQLDAAQATNSEMEAELRRLKVQADQWRKAAEAAAAILSTGNNDNFLDKSGSLDINYNPVGGKMESPYSEDIDDDSPKKRNGNMLKKIGVLWKKSQK
ncbi:hypothetical protein RJ641_028232 [Dillenia turbinata]|uniref:Uncharacterized protein n=1 Tax=Dillenia turbinata TaxID=194707 RepID=A0AAN8ZR86_9MAGN